jgi:hypothetical protein
MHETPSKTPTRRTLRKTRSSARRRPALAVTVATGAALGILVTTGFAAASPAVAVAAASTPLAASTVAIASSIVGAETLSDIRTDAQSTLLAARVALTEADAITARIEASGLDIGVDRTTIDTSALQSSTDQLANLDVVPALLVPGMAEDTATATQAVADRVDDLSEHLVAAQTQKAAEEAAAAAAAAAAEAAAEAQRQAEAAAAALAAANTPEGAKALAAQMASASYGWGSDQFSCLASLWQKESSWNYQAYNASSGATGIPQALPGSKMASAGTDWQTNAATQIAWGLGYISSVYGTPCSAWGHSQSTNWY